MLVVAVGICRTAAAGNKKKREWIDFFPLKHSQAINLTAGCVCMCGSFFQIPTGERARARLETHFNPHPCVALEANADWSIVNHLSIRGLPVWPRVCSFFIARRCIQDDSFPNNVEWQGACIRFWKSSLSRKIRQAPVNRNGWMVFGVKNTKPIHIYEVRLICSEECFYILSIYAFLCAIGVLLTYSVKSSVCLIL